MNMETVDEDLQYEDLQDVGTHQGLQQLCECVWSAAE
jgi:TFIIF-interacting CTD phosphatase-like protein